MPFKKIGKDKYESPTGRIYNEAQVRLYYANNGFPVKNKTAKKKSKKKGC